jgi:hypothetical protein
MTPVLIVLTLLVALVAIDSAGCCDRSDRAEEN